MILIPVKNVGSAKQRLAPVAGQPARTALAQAMLRDVVAAVVSWVGHPPAALVTSDPFAVALARDSGLQVISDPSNVSETSAIEMATAFCLSHGTPWTMVIPADIPLMKGWELKRLLDAAPPEGTLLVPAADGRGTNAVFRRPAGLFPLRFGNDSFQPHLAAARATGKPVVVIESPGIALDVDNPAELLRLVHAPGNSQAQQLARRWNIAGSSAPDADPRGAKPPAHLPREAE